MRTIGLLGGMSWESTVTYYKSINTGVKERLGGLHSAKCVLYSVDFAEIEHLQMAGEWAKAGRILNDAAKALKRAGAGLILLCTNTMHKVAPAMMDGVGVPFVHIATATAGALQAGGVQKAALLGTRYTMEQDFIKSEIENSGIAVLTPNAEERAEVDRIIFAELCLGEIKESSKQALLAVIQRLQNEGAGGVILGCTELGLLVQQADCSIPVVDTAVAHAQMAVELALEEDMGPGPTAPDKSAGTGGGVAGAYAADAVGQPGTLPTVDEAEQALRQAEAMNPGAWVPHSRNVAEACRRLAARLPGLDETTAYVLGLLHDIGRREGVTSERHLLDGYRYCTAMGWQKAAQICISHAFMVQDVESSIGQFDMPQADKEFMRGFVNGAVYDDYDRLVQLCDSLALPEGFCILEKRFVDVTLRYGAHPWTVDRWKAVFAIKDKFEAAMGCPVYEILPEAAENSLG